MRTLLFLALALFSLPAFAIANGENPSLTLWYDKPAEAWTDALPVGNGRMGAMVFGGAEVARWQFNEDTLWAGGPHNYAHAGAAEYLPKIRELLFAGKQKEAEQLAAEHFMSVPLRHPSYQPFGDVTITFDGEGEVTDYHRELNLDTAIATTSYRRDGVKYTRHSFASYPDGVIVIHLTSSEPGKLNFTAKLTSAQPEASATASDKRTLLIAGKVRDVKTRAGDSYKGQVRYASHLRVANTDGKVTANDDGIRIIGASRATLLLTAATSHVNYRDLSADPVARSEARIESASNKSLDETRVRHIADHQELFHRVTFDLGDAPDLPTDDRVLAAKSKADPALAALFFNYGRYLIIASSRPGGQPANLQGLWNDRLDPPWNSSYTTNINLQMNYWLTDPCNLPVCAEPLFAALAEVAESGRETARVHYDAPGWVVHHNFDIWRGTAPINASNHGTWPTGGAWLCQHLYLRYAYSGDEQFLRETAYPLLKGASEFYAATLVDDPRSDSNPRSDSGWLLSGPSNSPENRGLVMGPTMDHQIIRNLFANTIEASIILGVDEELRGRLQKLHARIAPNQIGKHGQLQEWLEDIDNPGDKHRHVSHLWGLHPGIEITPDTPKLLAAARQSLEFRGDGGTGWSRAWKINFWARLRDGDRAHKVLGGLLTLTHSPKTKYRGGGIYPNLFDAHPPFQIDGNFGATSGICEMLVQSHRMGAGADGKRLIELLPALPSAWSDGKVTGLCTRDGFVIDLEWRDGQLLACRVRSTLGRAAVLKVGEHETLLDFAAGVSTTFDGTLGHSPQVDSPAAVPAR